MFRTVPRAIVTILSIVVVLGLLLFVVAPRVIDARANRTLQDPPYRASDEAKAMLARLFVVDLHADSLLWQRKLGRQHSRGHVDVPRLIEGNVALQGFTIVTKVPWGLNIEKNSATARDLITPLVMLQLWPRPTWTSLMQRALHQTAKLRAVDAAREDFTLIRSRDDLAAYQKARAQNPAMTAGFLGIEGAHALEGNLENIDVLFDAGVRMMAPTHFFDTEVSGSAHGEQKGGLTPMGREMIGRMEKLGMLVDLAHASDATIDDATAMATRPLVVSHTGVKGTCDNTRNLDDSRIREVAGTRGVIGIGYWETAVCGTDAAAIARAVRYVVNLVGVDTIALGSDFDGAIAAPFDVTGMPLLVDALIAEGFNEGDITRFMGGNAVRVLSEVLPSGEPQR
jgi:microsomal dipeptidase-like Zn-dependent dipeptidase